MKRAKEFAPLLLAVLALEVVFRFGIPWLLRPNPDFWTLDNQIGIAQQISVNAVIAFGITLTILIGGIDLSVGAVLALAGTTTVYLLGLLDVDPRLPDGRLTFPSLEPGTVDALMAALRFGALGVAVLAGLGTAVAFGAFNGVCAAKTRMPAFIITLGTMKIARGLAHRFNEGRPIRIPEYHTEFLALGNGRLFGVVPYSVLLMLAIFAAAAVLLHRTRFGQHLYAMGGNREAARFTGIPLARNEVAVYVLCALLAGVAGLVNVSQLYSAEPASGEGFELDAIAAAVVGGTSFTGGIGKMAGTLIGAVIIGILNKGLNQAGVHYSLQYVATGVVILAAVYLDVRRRA